MLRHGFGGARHESSWGQRGTALKSAPPALVLTGLIVGGIRYGVFSATEAGAVAALYSVLCGVLIYRAANGATLAARAARSARRDGRRLWW